MCLSRAEYSRKAIYEQLVTTLNNTLVSGFKAKEQQE